MTYLRLMRIYVRIHTHVDYFDEETKTAHLAGRRGEHGRGRPRESRERRSWSGTFSETPHRNVDVISSYNVYGSKPGLIVTFRVLSRHGQHIYIFMHFFDARVFTIKHSYIDAHFLFFENTCSLLFVIDSRFATTFRSATQST